MSGNNEYLLKICLISSASELKTEFIRSFTESNFDRTDLPTLGVDITTKKIYVGDIQVKLILVDTAGQEFFGKLRPSYYRGTSAAVILFDKSDRQSFEDVPKWSVELQKYNPSDMPVSLVGLITSPEENSDAVPLEEGDTLASKLHMTYFESEPTDGHQVNRIFSHLAQLVIERKG